MESKKSLLTLNVIFWLVAISLHPLSRLVPTGSGETPKIYDVLIPIFSLLLAMGSTYLVARAFDQKKD